MITYEHFAFAAPPRTGTTWFIKACALAGLGEKPKTDIHKPFPDDWTEYTVSLVRHPVDWLASYYLSLHGGHTDSPCDILATIAHSRADVQSFVSLVARRYSGIVSGIFDQYNATSILRLEDFPWAPIEFIESVGGKKADYIRIMPAQNARKGQVARIDSKLRKELMKSESDFCERYEYV